MSRITRRLIGAAATTMLAAGLSAIPVAPTEAAVLECGKLQTQSRYWQDGETTFLLRMCVYGGDGKRAAVVKDFSWKTTDPTYPDDIFYYVKLKVRLERYDADKKTKTCDFTDNMNKNLWAKAPHKCYTSEIAGTGHGWTGDGVIVFDVVGDGKGKLKEQLTGSPSI